MILRPEQIKLLRLGCPATPANGGGGESNDSSKTSNDNINVDRRMVSDGESVAISADGSTVTVDRTTTNNFTQTDLGAIERAFDFSTNSRKAVTEEFKQIVGLAGEALDFSKETARLSSNAQANATEQISKAISVVQENITGNKYLVTLGMITAGIVALAAFGGQFGKIKL